MGSKKSKSTQRTILDPQTQELNNMRLEQERLIQPFRARAAGVGPGEAVSPTFASSGLRGSPFESLKFTNPEIAEALGALFGLSNVNALQTIARENFAKFAGPEIIAGLNKMGLGRSGAGGEAISRGLASIELPLMEEGRQAMGNFANMLLRTGEGRFRDVMNLANPSGMSFTPAPTIIKTGRESGGGFGDFLGPLLSFGGSDTGRAIGSGIGRLGSSFFGAPFWSFGPGGLGGATD